MRTPPPSYSETQSPIEGETQHVGVPDPRPGTEKAREVAANDATKRPVKEENRPASYALTITRFLQRSQCRLHSLHFYDHTPDAESHLLLILAASGRQLALLTHLTVTSPVSDRLLAALTVPLGRLSSARTLSGAGNRVALPKLQRLVLERCGGLERGVSVEALSDMVYSRRVKGEVAMLRSVRAAGVPGPQLKCAGWEGDEKAYGRRELLERLRREAGVEVV